MYQSLRGKLPHVDDHSLVDTINGLTDLKKATGIVGGFIYLFPPVSFLATLASTTYLKHGAKQMLKDIQNRIEEIDKILEKSGKTKTHRS